MYWNTQKEQECSQATHDGMEDAYIHNYEKNKQK